MDLFARYFLSLLIFLPALGAAAMGVFRHRPWNRWIGLATTVLTFALSLSMLATYDWHAPANGAPATYACRDATHRGGVVQFVARVNLIPAFHIQYFVGIDGLSLPLVLLTGFIFVLVCVASWKRGMGIRQAQSSLGPPMSFESRNAGGPPAPRDFAILLLLESALLGTFLSLNLAFFLFFFAVSASPIAWLLRANIFSRNQRATLQFSGLMLASILLLFIATIVIYRHGGDFDLIALPAILGEKYSAAGPYCRHGKPIFLLLMSAFLIRLPVVPFHRWLSAMDAQAPATVGMIVSALLLSTAGYGILRVAYPLFPEAGRSLWLVAAIPGVVNILYGGFAAMAQQTFRRLVSCISIFQMGLVLLGAAAMMPAATQGAIFMFVAHGIIIAMLLALGGVLVDRLGHDDLDRVGGLARGMPVFSGYAAVAILAGAGVPILCGFVGELLVVIGVFQSGNPDSPIRAGGWGSQRGIDAIAILGCIGILLMSVSLPWRLQRIFFDPPRGTAGVGVDLKQRDLTLLTPMLVAIILLGILPTPLFLALTRNTIEAIHQLAAAY